MTVCECGVTYQNDSEFDHVCVDEDNAEQEEDTDDSKSAEDDENDALCSDCDEYYPSALSPNPHREMRCAGCKDEHCKKWDCGEVARLRR